MADDNTIQGLFTALVTPFDENNEIDKEAWEKHLDYQLEGGVDGLLVSGTTGESPTFSDDEFEYLVRSARKAAGDDRQVIAGSGSNDTKKTIRRSRIAEEAGADALLVVAPYYNKPTQSGMIAHYTKLADAVDLPQIVYNVPGRTGVNILPKTLVELSAHPNIVAVKEASGDIGQVMKIIDVVPDDFSVLSGDDAITLPLIACGGKGLISVASNEAPSMMKKLMDHCLKDEMASARELHYKLLPLMKANFLESNPIPVKAAMAMMGRMKNQLRLPLVPMSIEHEEEMRTVLKDLRLI